jgi:acetylornithine deacetylase/succinyl-diaminopimelate desuccinylase family protein
MGKSLVASLLERVSYDEIENLLHHLIKIESHQEAEDQEVKVAQYIQTYFQENGIEVEWQEVVDGRANVIARIKGNGTGPTLVLNGHLDTVPAYEMVEAFITKVRDGKIYGRGSVDMKGALAAMIAVLVSFKRSGLSLNGDLMFVGTIGEESYSPGAYHLVTHGFTADYAIVGEPTNMRVGIAHKGVIWGEAEFDGLSVHGSVPDKGINAIYKASNWIQYIQRNYIPTLKQRVHPILGAPTINIGMIEGGTRPVIVPNKCRVKFERRMIPGETNETVLKELREGLAELTESDPTLSGEIKELPNFCGVPHGTLQTPANSPLVASLCSAYQDEFQEDLGPIGLQYWTDGAILQQLGGIETVVCGPGDIAQAHSNHEYIEQEQLFSAFKMYARVAFNLCINQAGQRGG